ncbi:MAG: SUMF1/EgtB/PvdO family nonheme iron enzyme [bacterium]
MLHKSLMSSACLVLVLLISFSCTLRRVVGGVSSAKNITAFSVINVTGTITNESIIVAVPFGTDITKLVPTIEISEGASISPASGVSQNFTNSVSYTVTAADATKKDYVVTVSALGMVAGDMATFNADGVTFKMAYVPGGLTFKAGPIDSTPTTVSNSYWIGETSVTYELWNVVRLWATNVARGPNIYSFANEGFKGSLLLLGGGNIQQPVTKINWRDAMIWMNALTEWYNEKNNTQYTCAYYIDAGYTTPIRTSTNSSTITYTADGSQDAPYVKTEATGFRMLTSMEWELAARYKGSNSADGGYEWPVGSGKWWTPGNYASGATAACTDRAATRLVSWFLDSDGGDSGSVTHDVKGKAANALGLYDMSGNVSQFNFDWGVGSIGLYRARRGGDYHTDATELRLGIIPVIFPYSSNTDTIGFRVARTNL